MWSENQYFKLIAVIGLLLLCGEGRFLAAETGAAATAVEEEGLLREPLLDASEDTFQVYLKNGELHLEGHLKMRFAKTFEAHGEHGFEEVPWSQIQAIIPLRGRNLVLVLRRNGKYTRGQLVKNLVVVSPEGIEKDLDLRKTKIVRLPYPDEQSKVPHIGRKENVDKSVDNSSEVGITPSE